VNRSWKIVLVLLIALTASHNAWGDAYGDLAGSVASEDSNGENITLKIFGNANMDDLINAKDITYVEGILNGANKQTDLADANRDGKVDQEDIDRIKQIINGTESELYYIDCNGDVKRVRHPLKKIIIAYDNTAEAIRILEAQDRVIGVDSLIQSYPRYFPEFNKTPSIGSRKDCDAEKIIELNPDALVVHGSGDYACTEIETKLKDSNVDVIRLDTWEPHTSISALMTLAYMLDEVDNALKYREWQNGYLNIIRERVSSVPINKRPKAFVDRWGNTTVNQGGYSEAIEIAGGINIAASLTGSSQNTPLPVDAEWVLKQNPDIIIGLSNVGGYENDDISVLKARYDECLGAPGIENTNAGKNKKVYVTYYITTLGPGYHIGVLYFEKWLYPDLFKDLDPQAVHQEYIDKFQHVDFDLDKHGVFVYPPLNKS